MTYKDKGIRYNRNGMLLPGLMQAFVVAIRGNGAEE